MMARSSLVNGKPVASEVKRRRFMVSKRCRLEMGNPRVVLVRVVV